MNFLRKQLDNLAPKVQGNKFLHSVYDGIDTLLYRPNTVTQGATHLKDSVDLKRTMFTVVVALSFCYLGGIFNMGVQHYHALGLYDASLFDGWTYKFLYGLLQIIPIFIVVHVVGLGIEFAFAASKGHGIEEGFLVSGALIPLIMPPDVPLWIVAVATAFAVVIAKEAFGGTGMNLLNVALTARVFVFFAYPSTISGESCWVAYDYNFLHTLFGLKAHTVSMLASMGKDYNSFFGPSGFSSPVDGWSGATPLAKAAVGGWHAVHPIGLDKFSTKVGDYSVWNMTLGVIPGSVGEMSKIGILIGAVILLLTRIASWRVMLSMVLGCAFAGVLFNIFGQTLFPDSLFINVPWYYHFIMGGFMFAAVFMATDPVTAAGTNTGKLIYGFAIGMIGMIIRVLNPAYPEGWMLAILFLNVFAPLIDYFVIQSNIKKRIAHVA